MLGAISSGSILFTKLTFPVCKVEMSKRPCGYSLRGFFFSSSLFYCVQCNLSSIVITLLGQDIRAQFFETNDVVS